MHVIAGVAVAGVVKFDAQLPVLILHELHLILPLIKLLLYLLQLKLVILPKLFPSQVSFIFIIPLPHGGASTQLDVFKVHAEQDKLPPEK